MKKEKKLLIKRRLFKKHISLLLICLILFSSAFGFAKADLHTDIANNTSTVQHKYHIMKNSPTDNLSYRTSKGASLSKVNCRYQSQVVKIADYILSLQCPNGAIVNFKGATTVNTDSNMEYALIGLGAAYQLTAASKYLDSMKKGICWLASKECMTKGKWKGSWWYEYDIKGKHIPYIQGNDILDVRGVDTTSALFVYLLYLDNKLDPDSELTRKYHDNAISALNFIINNNLDSDYLSRSSWQKNSTGKWSIYDCKYSADQGDVYLGFHAADILFNSQKYKSLAKLIKENTEKTFFDDTLGRYCTSIENGTLDRQLNSFDPIQSQGFLPWVFGDDAYNRLSVSWLSKNILADGSISCYENDPKYALSVAILGMGENSVSGEQPTSSYNWVNTYLLDSKTGGISDSLIGSEKDCNVAGLYIIALSQMHSFRQPYINGVTLNDVTNVSISDVIDATDAMKNKPTVRIVMKPGLSASSYLSILKKLHGHAFIMLCPCDSSYLKHYKTTSQYLSRYKDCVRVLAPYVDIWEVGNEINGEGWTKLSSKKASHYMYSAWKYLYSLGFVTELTPYEFRPGDQSIDMIPWLKKYVPKQMKKHIGHVLISYYDDDNDGVHNSWKSTFNQLKKLFPNSYIGFGECGFSTPHNYDEDFQSRVKSYYSLSPINDRYEGGYFWWYWQEDCLPYQNNPSWNCIEENILH